MKKLFLQLLACLSLSLFLFSCEKEDLSYDENLIIGTWRSGTEYYKYKADGTGGTWDTSDDVTEDEAQPFTWTLVKSDLTHIHIMQTGPGITKSYTVTELTATTLKYEDDFGKSYSFVKVK